jgi:hypothetical protein
MQSTSATWLTGRHNRGPAHLPKGERSRHEISGYLVMYDPVLSPVHVLRVVRGARDLSRISTQDV